MRRNRQTRNKRKTSGRWDEKEIEQKVLSRLLLICAPLLDKCGAVKRRKINRRRAAMYLCRKLTILKSTKNVRNHKKIMMYCNAATRHDVKWFDDSTSSNYAQSYRKYVKIHGRTCQSAAPFLPPPSPLQRRNFKKINFTLLPYLNIKLKNPRTYACVWTQ